MIAYDVRIQYFVSDKCFILIMKMQSQKLHHILICPSGLETLHSWIKSLKFLKKNQHYEYLKKFLIEMNEKNLAQLVVICILSNTFRIQKSVLLFTLSQALSNKYPQIFAQNVELELKFFFYFERFTRIFYPPLRPKNPSYLGFFKSKFYLQFLLSSIILKRGSNHPDVGSFFYLQLKQKNNWQKESKNNIFLNENNL